MENPSLVKRKFSSTHAFALKAESCCEHLWDEKCKVWPTLWRGGSGWLGVRPRCSHLRVVGTARGLCHRWASEEAAGDHGGSRSLPAAVTLQDRSPAAAGGARAPSPAAGELGRDLQRCGRLSGQPQPQPQPQVLWRGAAHKSLIVPSMQIVSSNRRLATLAVFCTPGGVARN